MRKLGVLFVILGLLLIGGAVFLFMRNDEESDAAGDASAKVLAQLVDEINNGGVTPDLPGPHGHVNPYDDAAVLRSYEMKTVEIDGNSYIGWISLPALNVELPVMADLDYTKLKLAPCRMLGSVKSGDLIIAGHNYRRHFRELDDLHPGDFAYFIDVEGVIRRYVVTGVEVLGPTDVQLLKEGDWDMTVFTCTYGGAERIVVRFTELPDSAEIVTVTPEP